ncbi:MAG TPA: M55 family metallopeptidase [Actinopolymorphaceae bacterium]|jgi:D-amino peptidase
MRVLVSVDMEGVAGVVDPADVRPGEPEYERNRHLMTAEANAAIRGVLTYDSTAEVIVSDAHAQFRNLLPEKLDRRARLLRGKPKLGGMLAGIETGVDACVFVGYHGQAGKACSVLAHTVSSAVIADVRCNERSLGEIGLNVALAAHHGAVPVLVTGDDTVALEAADLAPGMRTVVVKRALGARAADSLHPGEACDRIEAEVSSALRDRESVKPLRFDGQVTLEVDVLTPAKAELAAFYVPGMQRPSGTTLRYVAPDFPTAHRVVSLIAILGNVG